MAVTRRQGREWAVQMLFQADMNPDMDVDDGIRNFWLQQWDLENDARAHDNTSLELSSPDDRSKAPPPDYANHVAPIKIRAFAESRVRGVLTMRDALDERIERYMANWSFYRLGSVERNVLRLALYELLECTDVPVPVVLNEAIDLAKYFSNADAGRFVNGILDRASKEITR